MRSCSVCCWCHLPPSGQSMTDNPQVASSKAFLEQIKDNVLKSADKMPEEKFSFKPAEGVRTYGQLLAHIADAQYLLCGIAKDGKQQMKGIEKSAHTKAEIVRACTMALAYCEGVYSDSHGCRIGGHCFLVWAEAYEADCA